jgi:hypothetical protein
MKLSRSPVSVKRTLQAALSRRLRLFVADTLAVFAFLIVLAVLWLGSTGG